MVINTPFLIEICCSFLCVYEIGRVNKEAVTLLLHQLEENHMTHWPG